MKCDYEKGHVCLLVRDYGGAEYVAMQSLFIGRSNNW